MGQFADSLLRNIGPTPYQGGPLTLYDQMAMARGQLPGSQLGSQPQIPMADAVVKVKPPVTARPAPLPEGAIPAVDLPTLEAAPIPGANLGTPDQSIRDQAFGATPMPQKRGVAGTIGQILLGLVEGGVGQSIYRGTGQRDEDLYNARFQRNMANYRQIKQDEMAMKQFADQQAANALGLKKGGVDLEQAQLNLQQDKDVSPYLTAQAKAQAELAGEKTTTERELRPVRLEEAQHKVKTNPKKYQIRTTDTGDGFETDVLVDMESGETKAIAGIKRAKKAEAAGAVDKGVEVEVEDSQRREAAFNRLFPERERKELETKRAKLESNQGYIDEHRDDPDPATKREVMRAQSENEGIQKRIDTLEKRESDARFKAEGAGVRKERQPSPGSKAPQAVQKYPKGDKAQATNVAGAVDAITLNGRSPKAVKDRLVSMGIDPATVRAKLVDMKASPEILADFDR